MKGDSMRQLFLALLLLSSLSFAGEHVHDENCDDRNHTTQK